eukprot:138897-Amphidinium_carterae.1
MAACWHPGPSSGLQAMQQMQHVRTVQRTAQPTPNRTIRKQTTLECAKYWNEDLFNFVRFPLLCFLLFWGVLWRDSNDFGFRRFLFLDAKLHGLSHPLLIAKSLPQSLLRL